jgi:hypothetical protein
MSGEPGDAAPLVIQTGDQPFGGELVENVECHALLATLLFHVVMGDDSGHGPPVVAWPSGMATPQFPGSGADSPRRRRTYPS